MVLGYWVELIDDENDAPAKPLLGLSSAVEAAGIYAQSLVEDSQGAWTGGAIRVWNKDQGRDDATVFDVSTTFAASTDDDAEEGDMDCEMEIIERE